MGFVQNAQHQRAIAGSRRGDQHNVRAAHHRRGFVVEQVGPAGGATESLCGLNDGVRAHFSSASVLASDERTPKLNGNATYSANCGTQRGLFVSILDATL